MGAIHAGWQKPGSLKYQVLISYIHHKMVQRVTNAGFGGNTYGLAKARIYKITRPNPLHTP